MHEKNKTVFLNEPPSPVGQSLDTSVGPPAAFPSIADAKTAIAAGLQQKANLCTALAKLAPWLLIGGLAFAGARGNGSAPNGRVPMPPLPKWNNRLPVPESTGPQLDAGIQGLQQRWREDSQRVTEHGLGALGGLNAAPGLPGGLYRGR